jgi:hypothetical protein
VHGFYRIVMTDNYPAGPNQWRVGMHSVSGSTTVTIYAITIGGAKVSIADWNTGVDGGGTTHGPPATWAGRSSAVASGSMVSTMYA